MGQIQDRMFSHWRADCKGSLTTLTMDHSTMSQMEFAVNMTCGSCKEKVKESLQNIQGIESLSIDVDKQSVIIKTTQPSTVIQEAIERTGMLAVLRGQGQGSTHLGAAISILKQNERIFGLVRFVQIDNNTCVIDGSFNGLIPNSKHALHVHELGDLSEGCESTGDDYNPTNTSHGDRMDNNRHTGDLGNINVDANGSSVFRYEDNIIKVWDIIGRSMVIHEGEDDLSSENHGNAGKGMACGIIARSAGMFENTKKVCACTGKTLWEEREEARTMYVDPTS
ncbi:copper chaperone for superoxide dismutase-like isoform X2 [Hydractinia symbiolongicarpus]|uniref:copper chaperone for superoxide dismutase-like isoform X2 n=1 Tax=Hydractinia symbiolongicarpus TaxID=13093 RepID=UPI0025508A09|nr:copper chaperone for superoxide dismutase-like isoform X2 [Hydractinia symbiolongicarpus]